MNSKSNEVNIEITSDFICPWCFIAERRLLRAAKIQNIKIMVNYIAYELNPNMPTEGKDRKSYRSSKFGSWEKSKELDAGTLEASIDDDLKFNYDIIEYTPNTLLAHRFIFYVSEKQISKVNNAADLIFEAYFSKGIDIGSIQSMIDIAEKLELDLEETNEFLSSDKGTATVKTQSNYAVSSGLRGVPLIKIEGVEIYGAQPFEKYNAVLAEFN